MAWESGVDSASPATVGRVPSGTTGAGDGEYLKYRGRGPWVGTASPATAGHAPCGTTRAGDL